MSQQENLSPAEAFDRFFGPTLFTPWVRVLLEYAAPQPSERVLDLACGTGTVARLVTPMVGAGGKVVGLDINPNMLAVARARPAPEGAAIEWRVGDAVALPLPDDAFDLVLCQQGLQFFPDRAAATREMRRVLTDGGRVALDLWRDLDRHPLYEAMLTAEARYLGIPMSEAASPWSLPDAGELRGLLEQAGFRRIEITPRVVDVHFPQADRFVYLTLFAGSAFAPDFDWEDEPLRSALIEQVSREIQPVMGRYMDGDGVTFPTSLHFAVAYD